MSVIAPKIPDSAPFSEAQRNWLDGYIAAFQNRSAESSTPKEKVLVLYASQSGNSESLAEEFGKRLGNAGFNAPVFSTEDFPPSQLAQEKRLLIVSSTWGEGDPPDNAVEFWSELSSENQPSLQNLQFSVLGLGDTNYIDFCGMGKKFDARLVELGATRISPRGDCDTDYEETSEAWFTQVMEALGTAESTATFSVADSTELAYSKKNPFPAKLITNQRLNAPASARDTRHFEISLAGSGFDYQVGDVIGILPKNDPDLLKQILGQLSLEPTADQWTTLMEDRDICTLTSKLIEAWKSYSKTTIDLTADQIKEYADTHHLFDLVSQYPASFPDTDDLIGLLRKMAPRLYSISSSPLAHQDEVHLTIARVEYDLHGRQRRGVCSTYLSDRVTDDDRIRVFHQEVKHFKLPEDASTPVIMVGPGTGIAPFRAFLEHRSATGSPGKNWLFFGNPHQATDWFYQDQFQSYVDAGLLTRYDLAWSRDQDEKIYVQDKIRENGAEIWKWIGSEGACFYVCGDAKRMAKDVDRALCEAVANYGGLSEEEAAEYVARMKKEKRYQRDVY